MLFRFFLTIVLLLTPLFALGQQVPQPVLAARSWMLIDVGSGQTLASQNENERSEPASLTKLMTAYVVFSALRDGKLTLDQSVPVLEAYKRVPGSRMFIEPRLPVTVEELIKGMIVQSGNDACVALASAIAGSEEYFVVMMNQEAQRLGMKNTNFTNSTGLPDPQHYTTAYDLSLLTRALVKDFSNEYAKYYSMREFTYNKIKQPNRNRLLWLDPSVDGMKTGYTENAGYCLIASAKRGPRRLISIVLGTNSDSTRTQESLKLLNYGFQFTDAVQLYTAGQNISAMRIWKGEQNTVPTGFDKDVIISLPKGHQDKLKANMISQQPLIAPVNKGQVVGKMIVTIDGKPYGEYPILALQTVAAAGFFSRAWDTIRLWFN